MFDFIFFGIRTVYSFYFKPGGQQLGVSSYSTAGFMGVFGFVDVTFRNCRQGEQQQRADDRT